MPQLLLLAERAAALGSAGAFTADGSPSFPVGPGGIELLDLDYSGWLGLGETVATSTWTTTLATAGAANTGTACRIRVTIPAAPATGWPERATYEVTHTAVASGGRQRVTTIYLVA